MNPFYFFFSSSHFHFFLGILFFISLQHLSCSTSNISKCFSSNFRCENLSDVGLRFWKKDTSLQICCHPCLELNRGKNNATIKIRDAEHQVLNIDFKKCILKVAGEDNMIETWYLADNYFDPDDYYASNGTCGFIDLNQTSFCQDSWNYVRSEKILPRKQEGDKKNKKKTLLKGLGITGATIGVISLIIGFLLIILRPRKHAAQFNPKDETSATPSYSQTVDSISLKPNLENGISYYYGAQVFTYAELEEATNNFDSSKELGNGGFGTVYHGVLNDGRTIAVKRLYARNLKRVNQFTNEVMILTRLRHPNLVTLFGCTSRHSRQLLLVYEYIPNGTLADHLHGNRANSSLLTWSLRLNIAIQTATSLNYLHKSDIIHRDVKTNNILLDDNFCVKVGDFGLSRLFPGNVTHVSTAPQGTPGYFDPEYFHCFQLSEKSDVYSFGVVLIELISGEKAVDMKRQHDDINLSAMALKKIRNGTLDEMVDSSLGSDSATRSAITLVGDLAFECLKRDRDMRPSMDEVLETLRRIGNDDVTGTQIEKVMV